MESRPIMEARDGNKILRIFLDPVPDDPRGRDGTSFFTWIDRENLERAWPRIREVKNTGGVVLPLTKRGDVYLPLSWRSLSTEGEGDNPPEEVDAVLYCSAEAIRLEYGEDPSAFRRAVETIFLLLEQVNAYGEGRVYGYELYEVHTCPTCGHQEEKMIDACWGFYGEDWDRNGLAGYLGDDSRLLGGLRPVV
jgi:hypothetical protein